jgi:hypothetical protein
MGVDKATIIQEIRRITQANGGKPPGAVRFSSETGLKEWQWQKHWPRWGDALREAGFAPNEFQTGYDPAFLLRKYAEVARELGTLPTNRELSVRSRNVPDFPSRGVFERLGSKSELVQQLAAFCREHHEFSDVLALCEKYSLIDQQPDERESPSDSIELGYVYLMKSGRFYKIGKSNSAARRERELAIQLPEKLRTVHVISTDDPTGIEAYWHKRFEAKRLNGEWFDLDVNDVAAFKRRKFM